MNLNLKVILLYARPYSISENGKTNEGITIQYLISDNLNPVSTTDEFGFRVTKGSIPLDQFKNIDKTPGLYDGSFTMKTGADGKAALKLNELKFIKEIKTL